MFFFLPLARLVQRVVAYWRMGNRESDKFIGHHFDGEKLWQ
jgi:hypothetical protein